MAGAGGLGNKAILVTGIPKNENEENVKSFVEDESKSGGGEIKHVDFSHDGERCIISHQDDKVSDRMVEMKDVEYKGRKLSIAPVNLGKWDHKTITVTSSQGLKEKDKQMLQDHFSNKEISGGGPIGKIKIKSGAAKITFQNEGDALEVIKRRQTQSSEHLLSPKFNHHTLMKHKKECCVIITGIPEEMDDKEIRIMFEDKEKSGGGHILSIKDFDNERIIEFEKAQDAKNVLQKGTLKWDDHTLKIRKPNKKEMLVINESIVPKHEDPERQVDELQKLHDDFKELLDQTAEEICDRLRDNPKPEDDDAESTDAPKTRPSRKPLGVAVTFFIVITLLTLAGVVYFVLQTRHEKIIVHVITRCELLSSPVNGLVSVSRVTAGGKANFKCIPGYAISGDVVRTCQASGVWSGTLPICQAVSCGNVSAPLNGSVYTTNITYKGQATYSCQTGFKLSDNDTRICQANSTWNGSEPICTAVSCGNVTAPLNGSVQVNNITYMGMASYTCNEGFVLSENTTRTCLDNGTWSGRAPACSLVSCGNVSSPLNGTVHITNITYMDQATYTCQTGFVLDGNVTRTCQANGTWSGQQPDCIIVSCGNVSSPSNGTVHTTNITYMGQASYTCQTGFILSDNITRFCQANGSWSGLQPLCSAVNCGELLAPANGNVSAEDTLYGSIATYSCDLGYAINGSMLRYCEASGHWNATEPICTVVKCPNMTSPDDGTVLVVETEDGDQARFTCDIGYILIGSNISTCEPNKTWSNSKPECIPVNCGMLLPPTNGSMSLDNTTYGSKAIYTCEIGFLLNGTDTRLCEANGHWNGSQPECIVINCSMPLPIHNGDVFIDNTTYEGRAVYTCDIGYILLGPDLQICGDDGTWNGTEPNCTVVSCGNVTSPIYGNVSVDKITYEGMAVYSCDIGYRINGSNVTTCQANGTWSTEQPTCEVVNCGELPSLMYGNMSVDKLTYGGEISYRCDSDYILNGTSQRVCEADGVWSGSLPICEYNICGDLPSLNNGMVLYEAIIDIIAVYICNTGYILNGTSIRTCLLDGTWEGDQPQCEAVNCGNVLSPVHGQVWTNDTLYQGNVIYSCNEGYVLNVTNLTVCQTNGTDIYQQQICKENMFNETYMRTCIANGSWSGIQPQCEAVNCESVTPPIHGQVWTNDTLYRGNVTYSCDVGYFLAVSNGTVCQNIGTGDAWQWGCKEHTLSRTYMRTCLANATWSGDLPYCKVVNCGNVSSPIHGNVWTNDINYQGQAIYGCDKGYFLNGTTVKICQINGIIRHHKQGCKGYTYNDTNVRTCQADGTWSLIQFQCEAVDCGTLSPPVSGNVSTNVTIYGGQATYSCHHGYQITGENVRICQADGLWSGKQPSCHMISSGSQRVVNTSYILITLTIISLFR